MRPPPLFVTVACLLVSSCTTVVSSADKQPVVDNSSNMAANLTVSEDIIRDCSDLPSYSPSGVYILHPAIDPPSVPAYCDMEQDGGGWTVLLRRADIEPRQDFYLDWEEYKWGLGILDGEFYWGNEYLWMMTSHLDRQYQLHIYLEDWDGNNRHALYQDFRIESEADYYRLLVGNYSGDAGDSLQYHNGFRFSTKDQDHDAWSGNCAQDWVGAWWFKACDGCHLNGEYYSGGYSGSAANGITWFDWKSSDPYSMKTAVMKIKPSKKL